MQLWAGLKSRWEAAVLRAQGASLEGAVWLRGVDVPRNAWDIRLGEGAALDRGVALIASGERQEQPRISIGRRCYLNRYVIVDASERVEIGDDCLIGPYCYLTDHDHDPDCGVNARKSRLVSAPTRLDAGVWLGARVTVLKGVTIGAGSVVGAGAVVTHDIPPHSLALGSPARVVRALGAGGTLGEPTPGMNV